MTEFAVQPNNGKFVLSRDHPVEEYDFPLSLGVSGLKDMSNQAVWVRVRKTFKNIET